jgi:hypothetical protein
MAYRGRILMHLSAVGCLSAVLAGCSLSYPTDNPFTASMTAANDKPTVWSCAMVQMSSPPRYACSDNKTYTAFELRDARLDLTAEQAAGLQPTPRQIHRP